MEKVTNKQEIAGNNKDFEDFKALIEQSPEASQILNSNPLIQSNLPTVFKMAANNPAVRKDIIKYVKREFGFNLKNIFDMYFGKDEDEPEKLENLEMPLREIAENVLIYDDDGFSPSQIASKMGIFPAPVKDILNNRRKWEKDLIKEVKKISPWYVRILPTWFLQAVKNGI